MPRGQTAKVGETNTAANGYHYTRCQEGWRLTHHLTAEKKLGRPLREDETVRFIEPKFKRDPTNPDGIIIQKKGIGSLGARKAQLEVRIEQLQAELQDINEQIASQEVLN
jgi:hypothetical protein